MLGFDHELRRHGFAGNSCQIILELASVIAPAALEKRLAELTGQFPILNARPGGFLLPKWKLPRSAKPPRVRIHQEDATLCQRLFNEPLALHDGELLRFDLIQRPAGRMSLVFTWAHALLDAYGGESFLALVGQTIGSIPKSLPTPPRRSQVRLADRIKLAWKYLHHIDGFCQTPPRSIRPRYPEAVPALHYIVEKFSAAETELVHANSIRCCGILGRAQYHAAASVWELHQLHERLGSPSPSYILPVPVGLRLKGSSEPLFGNQVSMLMFQLLPEHLTSLTTAVAALKTQTTHAMRSGLLDSGRTLSELFRFLPLPLYMAVVKHGLRGEICSLFYGDTSDVNPQLTRFLDVPVEDFTHVAAVTPTPGVGVIFYYFRNELRLTVLHSAQILSAAEAARFAADLRAQLLNPS